MRRIALAAVLLVAAAAAAGCLGLGDDAADPSQADPGSQPDAAGDAGDDATDPSQAAPDRNQTGTLPDGSPAPAAFTREDCTLQVAEFPVPEELARDLAPGDLEPAPYEGAPATGSLIVVASDCTADGGGPSDELWGYVPVEPPEEVPGTDLDRTVAAIGSFVEGERLRAIYEAWNLTAAFPGNVTVQAHAEGPPGRAGHVEAIQEGFALEISTGEPRPAPADPMAGLRVLHLQEGVVASSVEVTWPADETLAGAAKIRATGEEPTGPEFALFNGLTGEAVSHPGPVAITADFTRLRSPEAADPLTGVEPADPAALEPRTAHTGFSGAEPSIGTLPSGDLYVQALDNTLRSTDGGETWESVYNYSYEAPTGETYPTYDPMLWTDSETGRVYWNHMRPSPGPASTTRCTAIGWSDDGGESWSRNDHACTTTGVDFQKLGGGPPGPDPNPMAGEEHPTVLYLCYNKQLPQVYTYDTHCSVSYDGGESWPVESRTFACVNCGGGAGRPAVADDGTAYVPLGGQIMYTTDSGLAWRATPGPDGVWTTQLEVGPDGSLYALALSDGIVHVARSDDGGQTWDGPWRASPAGIGTAAFQAFAVGEGGRVGVALVGTNASLDDPVDADDDARWHLHVAVTDEADGADPTFRTLQVTDDPVQVGPLCTYGACADTGARNLLDFIDAAAGPDGTFHVAFADGCTGDCATSADPAPEESRDDEAVVAWLEGWNLDG